MAVYNIWDQAWQTESKKKKTKKGNKKIMYLAYNGLLGTITKCRGDYASAEMRGNGNICWFCEYIKFDIHFIQSSLFRNPFIEILKMCQQVKLPVGTGTFACGTLKCHELKIPKIQAPLAEEGLASIESTSMSMSGVR